MNRSDREWIKKTSAITQERICTFKILILFDLRFPDQHTRVPVGLRTIYCEIWVLLLNQFSSFWLPSFPKEMISVSDKYGLLFIYVIHIQSELKKQSIKTQNRKLEREGECTCNRILQVIVVMWFLRDHLLFVFWLSSWSVQPSLSDPVQLLCMTVILVNFTNDSDLFEQQLLN